MTLPDYWRAASNYIGSGADLEQINYCTNPDPIHAASSIPTGWTLNATTGHTVTWSNGAVHDGITSKHFKCVYNGGADSSPGFSVAPAAAGSVTPGQTITAAAVLGQANLIGCTVRFTVSWYTSGSVLISKSTGGSIAPGAGFAQAVYSPTAPATADKFVVYLAAGGFAAGSTAEFSVCEVVLLAGVDVAPYYWNGDYPNCHWASARDASISHKHLARPNFGELIVEATTDHLQTGVWSPGIPVVAGADYGVSLLCEVARCVGGTFSCDVVWYTADDGYISGVSISGWLTAYSAETAYSKVVTAPATATQAYLRFWWNSNTTPTGDCVAHVRDASLGKLPGTAVLASCSFSFLCEPYAYGPAITALNNVYVTSPTVIECGTILGDYPTPLTIEFAWDVNTHMQSLWCGKLAPGSTVTFDSLLRDVELGTWSGGTTGASTSVLCHPAGGSGGYEWNASSAWAHAYFIDGTYDPGTYLVVVRAAMENVADSGALALLGYRPSPLGDLPLSTLAVAAPSTAFRNHEFGCFALPSAKTRGAATSWVRFDMKTLSVAGSGHAISIDYLAFVPTSWGFFRVYQTFNAGVDLHKLRVEGTGAVYQNDIGNSAGFSGAPIVALGPTRLAVFTESPAVAAAEHGGYVTVTYTPRYSLWQ